jgi:thiamine pyrophosphokinase
MKEKAVLFANGVVKSYRFIDGFLDENTFLVAVDGGLRHLFALNLHPNLLIGDLDSVSPEQIDSLASQAVEIRRFPIEKNETDLELALLEVTRRGYKKIILVGALGGRIDQTLANLFLLQLSELAASKVVVIDESQELFIIRDRAQIEGKPGDTLSLLPLNGGAEGVTTTGMRYPLVNEALFPDHSRGISNVMLESTAMVTITRGILLCVHIWAH